MPPYVPEQSALMRIRQATSTKELRDIRNELNIAMLAQIPLSASVQWNERVNGQHDAFIQRVVKLAEQALSEQGEGTPPVPYAFVLFGSGGRTEQTLSSDQDNGLIYADSEPSRANETETYFGKLAERIGNGLLELGYPPCSGDVLCGNPLWRQSLSSWKRTVSEWLDNRDWENVRYLLVVADMRLLYGESRLSDAVSAVMRDYIRCNRESLKELLANTLHRKVSLGPFGSIVRERYGEDAGGFDVKYGCYIPFVNGIRLLALQWGIGESSTEKRIRGLQACGAVLQAEASRWLEAFADILKFRAITPLQVEEGFFQTRGKLTVEQLTRELTKELKNGLHAGLEIAKFVKKSVAADLSADKKSKMG